MAKDLGISFMTDEIGLNENIPGLEFKENFNSMKKNRLPENKEFEKKLYREEISCPLYKKSICPSLFQTMIVNRDGKVFSCCWATDNVNMFGDLFNESFEDIRNNEKYRYSGSLFISRPYRLMQIICSACHNFKKNIKRGMYKTLLSQA